MFQSDDFVTSDRSITPTHEEDFDFTELVQ